MISNAGVDFAEVGGYEAPSNIRRDVGVPIQLFDDEEHETRTTGEWMALAASSDHNTWIGRVPPPSDVRILSGEQLRKRADAAVQLQAMLRGRRARKQRRMRLAATKNALERGAARSAALMLQKHARKRIAARAIEQQKSKAAAAQAEADEAKRQERRREILASGDNEAIEQLVREEQQQQDAAEEKGEATAAASADVALVEQPIRTTAAIELRELWARSRQWRWGSLDVGSISAIVRLTLPEDGAAPSAAPEQVVVVDEEDEGGSSSKPAFSFGTVIRQTVTAALEADEVEEVAQKAKEEEALQGEGLEILEIDGESVTVDRDGIMRAGTGGKLQGRALLWDAMGRGHWHQVIVRAAHPASNAYLVTRVMKKGDDDEADEEETSGDDDWRTNPLPPPPPPNKQGAFLPVEEAANLYGGGPDGVEGVLDPPVDHARKGDGRGGDERAPWEEPLSEMVLSRKRGAWVHRCRLQLRGESADGFVHRLLSAHSETEKAHRVLALQLAAECLPDLDGSGGTDDLLPVQSWQPRIRMPSDWRGRIEARVERRDDKSHSEKATQTFLQQEIMRRRGEIMAEVLHEADNDFRAVMGRLQIAQAVKDAVFKEEEAEEEAAPRAKAARATKAKRQPPLTKLGRATKGGCVAQSFQKVEEEEMPPADWRKQQQAERQLRLQNELDDTVSKSRGRIERSAIYGSLRHLKPHELSPPFLAKPGPPVHLPDREIRFEKARNLLSHSGCIHLGCLTRLPEPKWLCCFAAESGDLEALRFFRHAGCTWDHLTPSKAAGAGQLTMLRYVRSMGCEWTAVTCAAAAGAGSLSCLQFAREKGCPWDSRVTEWAVHAGHYDLYRWAVGEGCEVRPHIRARAEAAGYSV